jgi:hypothetical protein
LCDEVVKALDIRYGQDSLDVLQNYVNTRPRSEWAHCLLEFWDSITAPPPAGVEAFKGSESPHEKKLGETDATPDEAILLQERRPGVSSVRNGQAVFWRYSGEIFSALLHYSLAGGDARALLSSLSVLNFHGRALTCGATQKAFQVLVSSLS